jgi:fructose-1,6-bisphosphatase/inositol monophosphatase family enzyme
MTPKAVLVDALSAAGKLLRAGLTRGAYKYKGKGQANLITETDGKAQAAILRRVAKAFPEHGFLAEENVAASGRAFSDKRARWRESPAASCG